MEIIIYARAVEIIKIKLVNTIMRKLGGKLWLIIIAKNVIEQ